MARVRRALQTVALIQLITTLERQVFDFLGFMWAPILANFVNVLFIIFGLFGIFQCAPKYVFSFAAWNIVWLAWNAFVVCFYLNVGVLDRESDVLSLGTGGVSWWEVNGYGCRAKWDDEAGAWLRPTEVTGCFMHYSHVEALHGGIQCVLGFLSCVLGFYYAILLLKADDNKSRGSVKSAGHQSLYSIEFARPTEFRCEPPAKPMTPRRVKRRSVSSRHSTRHSSRRSSHRRPASHHSAGGHANPTYKQSSQHSLNDSFNDEEAYENRPASSRSNYSNFHGTRPMSLRADCVPFPPDRGYRNENYFTRPEPNPISCAEATPQVPQKRPMPEPVIVNLPYRNHNSQNSFLNSGPPAYQLHPSTSQYMNSNVDSETAM